MPLASIWCIVGIHLTQVRAVGGISWDERAHSPGGLPPFPEAGRGRPYLSEVDTQLVHNNLHFHALCGA
jgi:hypothetical protein